jgi:shikimate dehydrogenase
MINKDTEIYCSFAKEAGNTGCRLMNTSFYYYGLNKIYKSFSIDSIEEAVNSVRTLGIKGFAITMPFKMEVLKYVDTTDAIVSQVGAANTVINEDGRLLAYNTDAYAAMAYLDLYDNKKPLYVIGDGGYGKAVKWAARGSKFDVRNITRDNWDELFDIKDSTVYNCTPVEITDWVHKSNDFIDCRVTSQTGLDLATLQASKQFELYTEGMEFPL